MAEVKKTIKEQFADFKKDLAELFNVGLKFADFKLADGTIVRSDTDQLAQGSKVDAVDTTGNLLPLPDGEYTVPESGQKFTVESGYVKTLEAATVDPNAPAPTAPVVQAIDPNAKPPVPPIDDPNKSKDPHVAKCQDMLGDHANRIQMIEAKIGTNPATDEKMQNDLNTVKDNNVATVAKMTAIEKENKELKETFKKFFNLVEEMANATPEPTGKPKDKFKKVEDADREKILKFRKEYKLQ